MSRSSRRRNDVTPPSSELIPGACARFWRELRARLWSGVCARLPARSLAARPYRLAALALSLALACEPAAQHSPAAVPGAPAAPDADKSEKPATPVFEWQAQVGPATFYLLGSVHVARAGLYPLDARIEQSFAASDVLVLELALDEAAQLAAARRMVELGRLEPGRRLSDVVAPETYNLLVETQARRGQAMFGLRGFRPWFVALTLTTQALEAEGFSAELGIDEHFRRAAVGHKRIEAFETVESQMQLFTSLSPDAEEQLLRQTLEELDAYASELDAAFRLWSAGDANGIDGLLVAPMEREYPDLFERLFAERNRQMTERILALSKQPGRYFVVVGAGHLVGSSGILALLGARGIVSRQL
jgi:uncharacterized protein YbaP (TraB family)